MSGPTFEIDDVVDVMKGAITYRKVTIRKAEADRYEGTYFAKARYGNPPTKGRVSFVGNQVVAIYPEIFARTSE